MDTLFELTDRPLTAKQITLSISAFICLLVLGFFMFEIPPVATEAVNAAPETRNPIPKMVDEDAVIKAFGERVYKEGYTFSFEYNPDGNAKYFGYTAEDFDYLSQVIAGETYDDNTWNHKLYVGSVVLNRCKYGAEFKATIKENCLMPGQYSCFDPYTKRVAKTPTDRDKAAAYTLLKYGSRLPAGVIFQSEYQQGPVHKRVGVHYFCFAEI